MTLAFIPAGATEGHALINGDVITDFSGFTNNDAHAVVDKEAATDLRPGVNFDPGQPATEVRYQPRQPFQLVAPEHPGQTMNPDRMHPGVASQNFKSVTRRRVSMEYALDIFTQTLKHH
jgi:hypothetical protein